MFRKPTAALAAAALVALPVTAGAAPRLASDVEETDALVGSGLALALLGIAAVITFIVIDSDEDAPASP